MGLYALDHNVDRLAEDNARAKRIELSLAEMPGVASVQPADTNIVVFDLSESAVAGPTLVANAAARGVRLAAFSERRCRIVTHLDVEDHDVDVLLEVLGDELS